MRVSVKANGHNIFIPIPSCLIFNSLSAYFVYRFAAPHIDAIEGLSYSQVRLLVRGINRARHKLHGMPLVEVDSSGGELVRVYL
mgnify:CR=1 FL=1